MHKNLILIVMGTRPEVIKLSPVIKLMQESKTLEPLVVLTGQHGKILNDILEDLKIYPNYALRSKRRSYSLSLTSARIMLKLNKIIRKRKPKFTLVQGDTTSALMGALTSFYNKVPVGHVEAGLRTENFKLPFPEEANRRLISAITSYHFTPTINATNTLIREGHKKEYIYQTGNTGVDALLNMRTEILSKKIRIPKSHVTLADLPNIILVTCHRRESFGAPLEEICEALKNIAESRKMVNIIFPVHPNPNVRKVVEKKLKECRNIHLIAPLPYSSLIYFLLRAKVILTDSGGIQEEAPTLGKRVLVLRNLTEREEAIQIGLAKIVGTNKDEIFNATILELERNDIVARKDSNIYGNGQAAKSIVEIIEKVI